MNSVEEKLYDEESGLQLAAVWRLAWAAKSLIVFVVLVCALIAAVVAFNVTPMFRAETVILAVHNAGMGGGSGSLSSQLGGLAGIASLAGVNLESGGSAEREAKAILESRKLDEEFIKQNNLIPVLLAKSKQPTMWMAVNRFRDEVLTIREDKRTGLATLDFNWKDASVAAEWANSFVALANNRIRTRAIDEANRNLKFLNEQIEKTKIVEVQHSLFNLIENETKTLMLANARSEYAFTVIDPAVPPERKTTPHRSLYIVSGAFFGSVIGLWVAYLRRNRRTRTILPA